jgi:hypothetical protein
MMKKLIMSSLLFCSMMFFVAGSAFAVKPPDVIDKSNGFPSGEHYNLNIISKKDNFNCPCGYEPTKLVWDEDLQDYITKYNNVIFVPQDGETNRIFMQSGTSKKRNNSTYPELTVIDPCTEAFPDRNEFCDEQSPDGATLYLPKREAGYSVYARALGQPTDGIFEVTPGLNYVEDGSGNVLLFLGVVYPDGFEMPDGTFIRTSGKTKKGGGKSTALEITKMFEFNGTICYFDILDVPEGYTGAPTELCCDEVELLDENGETVLDENLEPVMVYENCVEKEFEVDCTFPQVQVTSYCVDYTTSPMWIFNVAEFVEYFWDVDSNGVHLLQVRFYPN